jgi:hypothetical protein
VSPSATAPNRRQPGPARPGDTESPTARPLVSAVVVSRNGAAYVRECTDSVLRQVTAREVAGWFNAHRLGVAERALKD